MTILAVRQPGVQSLEPSPKPCLVSYATQSNDNRSHTILTQHLIRLIPQYLHFFNQFCLILVAVELHHPVLNYISVDCPPCAGGSASFSVLGLAIPAHLMPFGSLVLTQVLIPRASFVGHLAGIAVGYAVGFGAFAWMNLWWTLCLAAWAIVGVLNLCTLLRRRHFPSSVGSAGTSVG